MVWAAKDLDFLERVAWGWAIVGWLHHHLCGVAKGARYLGGCSILLQVWAWEHITIPRPLPGRLTPSFPTIHRWSYGVWETEEVFLRLYYSLFLDTQAIGEIDWTPMSVDPIPHRGVEDRAARVIGEAEEGSIPLSLYEEKYKVVLRDVAALTDHGEGMMRQLRTACLSRNQLSGEKVTSLLAKCDSTIEEYDSIAEDLESLRRNFVGEREERVVAEVERDSMRDELGRV
ncbi:hypothetical protein AMTR_s00042p00211290 [Amborella trichopoda]|uniref:Aminotransferase-like plant mobile domain-containing protein n=1 Tax=Amborella trichopoda TaxID=13333 RepID=W1P189_AMBTC|nr:hypothetical protein AMTR_s00042p00211290 [Amborella trichopoda]